MGGVVSAELTHGAICLFFLAALILIAELKTQIRSESPEGYNNIVGGLSVLALVSVSNWFNSINLYDAVPFLSQPVFYSLASWIGVIVGTSLLMIGVSNWLPLARRHRVYNKTRVQHLEMLRRVEQLVGVESRLDTVLSTTLGYMIENFGFSAGAVFKYSESQNNLSLATTSGTDTVEADCLKALSIVQDKYDDYRLGVRSDPVGAFEGYPESLNRPQEVLPIEVSGRTVGFFMLWNDGAEKCGSDDGVTLRLAIDIIARKIDLDRLTLNVQALQESDRWVSEMQSRIDTAGSVGERIGALARGLNKELSVDYGALAIIEDDNYVRRYSFGPGGQVLVDAGLTTPEQGMLTGPAFAFNRTVTVHDLPNNRQPSLGEIVTDNDVRSLIALPVAQEGDQTAVMIVASRIENAYGVSELRRLEALRPVLNRLLDMEKASEKLKRVEARITRLNQTAKRLGGLRTTDEVLQEAARLISEETGADIVRISIADDEHAFLESRALVSTRPLTGMVPGYGQSIVSLMPVHERVLQDRVTTRVGRGHADAMLSEIETKQSFAEGITNALIVPITVGNKAVGVVAVGAGEDNAGGLESEATGSFIEAIAGLLAASLRTSVRPNGVATDSDTASDARELELRNRLKSPLTGIIGSVEYLKSRSLESDDEQIKKYVSILDRSVSKMGDFLREGEVVD